MNHDNSLHSSLVCPECQRHVMHAAQRIERWRWVVSYLKSDIGSAGEQGNHRETFVTQEPYTEQEIMHKFPVSTTKLERINFTKQWMDK